MNAPYFHNLIIVVFDEVSVTDSDAEEDGSNPLQPSKENAETLHRIINRRQIMVSPPSATSVNNNDVLNSSDEQVILNLWSIIFNLQIRR